MSDIEIQWYRLSLLPNVPYPYDVWWDVATVKQVHSSKIVHVDELTTSSVEADWLIARRIQKKRLAIKTADCTPVLFFWQYSYAAAHAWRRWLHANILEKTVKLLCRQWDRVVDIGVYIWPTISWREYEVGEEFVDLFWPPYVRRLWDSWRFSQRLFVYDSLRRLGVEVSNIHFHPDCTYTHHDRWASARRWDSLYRNVCSICPI